MRTQVDISNEAKQDARNNKNAGDRERGKLVGGKLKVCRLRSKEDER